MGKPKLTKELVARAVELKGHGLSNQDICVACGISEAAFYRWQEQGGKTELQRELVEGLKRAEAGYKDTLLAGILERGQEKEWQALAWLLERRFPAEFGRVDRIQATVAAETKNEITITVVNDGQD